MESVMAGRNDSSSAALPGEGSPALFSNEFALCMPKGEAANTLQMVQKTKRVRSMQTLAVGEGAAPGGRGVLWWGSSIPTAGLNWGRAEVIGTEK